MGVCCSATPSRAEIYATAAALAAAAAVQAQRDAQTAAELSAIAHRPSTATPAHRPSATPSDAPPEALPTARPINAPPTGIFSRSRTPVSSSESNGRSRDKTTGLGCIHFPDAARGRTRANAFAGRFCAPIGGQFFARFRDRACIGLRIQHSFNTTFAFQCDRKRNRTKRMKYIAKNGTPDVESDVECESGMSRVRTW